MLRQGLLGLGPLLLIAIIPYKQWALYWGAFPLWQAHRAAAIAAVLALCLMLVVRMLSRSWTVSTMLVGFLATGLLALLGDADAMLILLVVVGVAALLDRTRRYENALLALTIMSAMLFAGTFLSVVRSQEQERSVIDTETEAIGAVGLLQTPSIIHIVLDGYGSSEILSRIYGHDTTPFFSELERRGFSVIPDAVTPYSQTLPTLASVMSGSPVDLAAGNFESIMLRRNLGFTIRYGPVPMALERAGYTFAWSESGYHLLDFEQAQRLGGAPFWLTAFETRLLQVAPQLFGRLHNEMLKATLAPGTLQDLPRPFFYYQHLVAPHPPFSINADGSYRRSTSQYLEDGNHFTHSDVARRRIYIEGYREKIRFVEQALLRQIDSFPAGPKIVIIHGDHGPGAFLQHEDAARTCLAERMTTFAAVFSDAPGVTLDLASFGPRPFSIVNIYRLVLSRLSGTGIPPLEPRSRHIRWSDPRQTTETDYSAFDASCDATK